MSQFTTETASRIWDAANREYKARKGAKHPHMAPELLPDMASDQVRAVVNAIGVEFEKLKQSMRRQRRKEEG